MADGVDITAGSGTKISTDDIASGHVQRVKLVDGTDGGTAAIASGGGVESGALRVTMASDSTGITPVVGSVAHDSADSGKPVKIGGKARTTNPTAVADADRVDATYDDIGRAVVVPHAVRDLVGHQATTIASSSSETTIITAAGSGVFADLLSITLTNATATATLATLKDATTGTTRAIYAIAASGGITVSFPVPLPQATANNNWTITLSSGAVTVYIHAVYVKNV